MTQILRGFVKGVINKGSEQKPWALVGIESITKDRDGFDQARIYKFMVAGQQFKDGLANAYRSYEGAEVYVPYADEIDEFNGKSRIRYNLLGVPLRLQDMTATRGPAAAGSSQQSATQVKSA